MHHIRAIRSWRCLFAAVAFLVMSCCAAPGSRTAAGGAARLGKQKATDEKACWQNATVVIRAQDESKRAAGLNKSLPATSDLAVAGRKFLFFLINRFFGTFQVILYLQPKERTMIKYRTDSRIKNPVSTNGWQIEKSCSSNDTGVYKHRLRLRKLKSIKTN